MRHGGNFDRGKGVTALSSTRYPNKQNASKQPSKLAQASQGPLGARNFETPRLTRVSGPGREIAAPRGVALDIAPPTITLITGIEISRESNSKPRERPIIFITTFDLFCARPRAERTRRA